MPMTFPNSQLPAYIAQAPALPADKDRSEVRVYATIITAGVFLSFVMTAIYLQWLSPSLLHTVAMLGGYSLAYTLAFVLLAGCVAPHLYDLLFRPERLRDKMPRKIAARSMVLAAVLWGLLGNAARPLDVGILLPITYWVTAWAYLLVGGAYGYSLNAQLGEERANASTAENR